MIVRQSCSWCHTINTVIAPPVFCTECGHRAEVPRMDCDCPRCSSRRGRSSTRSAREIVMGPDSGRTAVRNVSIEYAYLVALIRRLRMAQKQVQSKPSPGGWSIVRGLERIVDIQLTQAPPEEETGPIVSALDQILNALVAADQAEDLDPTEGGGL